MNCQCLILRRGKVSLPSSRSIRRANERKAKKLEKKASAIFQQAADNMPKKCDECNIPFDKSDVKSFHHWRVAVYDDGRIHLVCPKCVPDDVKNQKSQ